MKTQKFRAYIKNLQYYKKENESQYGDPVVYYIQATLLETGKGRIKHNSYHNATIYISEDQYNTQELKVMDKIEIGENAKWKSKSLNLNVYDEKKLREFNVSKLQKDEQGRTFGKIYFYAYTLSAKQEDWTLVERADEAFYIQAGRTKIYIDENELNNLEFCKFFEKDVYDKISEINFQTIEMNCYAHKNIVWKKKVEVQSAFDEASGKYFANLIIKD